MYDLMDALNEFIQKAFEDKWYQSNTKEYQPLKFYISGLPPRDSSSLKEPFILLQPLSGEDVEKDDVERFALDIVVCTYVDRKPADGLVEQQEEGNREITSMIELIKKTIRYNKIVGGRFRFTGKLSWTLLDENPQPTPFFQGVVRVEYETEIVVGLTDAEAKAYGEIIN